VVEQWIDFKCELSVLVARASTGEMCSFPVAENIHTRHILDFSILPARITPETQETARTLAETIADRLGLVGLLAVELFLTDRGEILVNEMAPRPHNSGHWSMDGSTTSQFEQHLRAVLDLPLGGTGCHETWSVMVNVLGGPVEGTLTDRYAEALEGHPTVKLHNYGKAPRPGRKVGHVTAIGGDLDDVVYEARAAAAVFQD
jgi:5-(carboxyamino)imidazole ribonucleotide synthase